MTDEARNEYAVEMSRGEQGWRVDIIDPQGAVAWSRPCRDRSEAQTFASTVQQHIFWLSPAKFEEYYRLQDARA